MYLVPWGYLENLKLYGVPGVVGCYQENLKVQRVPYRLSRVVTLKIFRYKADVIGTKGNKELRVVTLKIFRYKAHLCKGYLG
jgi:hypothetical protein